MPLFPSLPADATTKHVFTAHPEIYSHFTRASEAIMRGPSPLSAAEPGFASLFGAANPKLADAVIALLENPSHDFTLDELVE